MLDIDHATWRTSNLLLGNRTCSISSNKIAPVKNGTIFLCQTGNFMEQFYGTILMAPFYGMCVPGFIYRLSYGRLRQSSTTRLIVVRFIRIVDWFIAFYFKFYLNCFTFIVHNRVNLLSGDLELSPFNALTSLTLWPNYKVDREKSLVDNTDNSVLCFHPKTPYVTYEHL